MIYWTLIYNIFRTPHHDHSLVPSQVRTFHHIMGGVVDPHAAYLLLRGLKTLDLRVERHNSSGLEIARRLEKHPKIDRVWYPGLESHPDHAIAKKQVGDDNQGFFDILVAVSMFSCRSCISNSCIACRALSLISLISRRETDVRVWWRCEF